MKTRRVKKWSKKGVAGRENPVRTQCGKCHMELVVKTNKTGVHKSKPKCPYCSGVKDPSTKKWLGRGRAITESSK